MAVLRMMRPFRRMSLAGMMAIVAAASLVTALAAAWNRSHGPVPLYQSVYFRTVAEPIVMVDAMGFSDGGSVGLRFVDARKTPWDICLENSLGITDASEGSRLLINGFVPDTPGAHRAPVSSIEERALLGVLERWSERRASISTSAASPADGAALYILSVLRKRN